MQKNEAPWSNEQHWSRQVCHVWPSQCIKRDIYWSDPCGCCDNRLFFTDHETTRAELSDFTCAFTVKSINCGWQFVFPEINPFLTVRSFVKSIRNWCEVGDLIAAFDRSIIFPKTFGQLAWLTNALQMWPENFKATFIENTKFFKIDDSLLLALDENIELHQ